MFIGLVVDTFRECSFDYTNIPPAVSIVPLSMPVSAYGVLSNLSLHP